VWYIMKYYAHFGHTDFILCLGSKGNLIKDYFLNYNECASNDFVLKSGGSQISLFNRDIHDWKITFVDTGIAANVGQRLKAVQRHLEGESVFLANYADGLSDLPLPPLIDYFHEHQAIAAFVAVKPSQGWHTVTMDDEGTVKTVRGISSSDVWMNGGYFVLSNAIFDHLREGEELVCEPFQRLIAIEKLFAYKYEGFWGSMDTFKEKQRLDDMYARGDSVWEVWKTAPGQARPLAAPAASIRRFRLSKPV
jgi:glucose-1-phosphate cytidylyltransferase